MSHDGPPALITANEWPSLDGLTDRQRRLLTGYESPTARYTWVRLARELLDQPGFTPALVFSMLVLCNGPYKAARHAGNDCAVREYVWHTWLRPAQRPQAQIVPLHGLKRILGGHGHGPR